MAHQRWPCKGWGWEWAWLIAVVGAWRIACIGWPCKSVTETRLLVLKLLLLSMWVPSQVYVCLIQLTIFAQVCCVRNVNGEMWPFQLPKGPWVPPFKVFFNRESVRTRDFTKWTPHLHIGLRKLARHDKTEKASFPEKQNSVNCKSNAPLSLWRQFCCLFGSQWRSQ